uniref:FBA_2 domain-containing protein n=1 Tax=Caenorhabditis tropicalis TaxID=1561998 RepID=A0A1I7UMK8_9PELO
MNMFIRNWMNGGNSNLQTLVFRLNQVDFDIILNGIPSVWRETPDDMSYDMGYNKDEPEYFNDIIEIRNVNGVVASIVIDIGKSNFFFIYVWPDFKGQPYPLEPLV